MADNGFGNKLNAKKIVSLQQTSILFFSCLSAVILLALVSFNPQDPSFIQFDSDAIIQNKAGPAGAYLASILIGFLGYLAYLIPLALLYVGFFLFRPMPRQGGLNTWLTVTGVFLALFCGCGLVTLLWPESSLTFKAGGLLGLMMAKAMVAVLGDFGSTVALFCGFFAGLTLILDISWLKVVDKVGEWALWLFEKVMGDPDDLSEGKKESRLKMPKMPKISLPKKKAKEEVAAVSSASSAPKAQPPAKTETKAKKLSIAAAAAVAGVGALVSRKGAAKAEPEELVINIDEMDELDELDEIPTIREVVKTQAEPLSAPPVKITRPAPIAPAQAPAAVEDDFDDEEEYLSPVALPKQKPAAPKKVSAPATANKRPPTEKLGLVPPLDLLEPAPANQDKFSEEQLNDLANSIQTTLADYGINGVEVVDRFPGPVVTRFEIDLPPGTKVSRISGLSKDIARSMRVPSIRIVEVIPGKTTIGIEIPNDTRELVAISEILNAPIFQQSKSPLTIAMGKTIAGNPAIADLAKMPHVLVAGTTGSGKSVAVNAMIMSLLYKSTPEQVKLILIDPKMLELSIYEGIPHLLTSVVTDMKDAANALRWCVGEMERRYAAMSYMKVRNIAGYNQKVQEAIDRGEPITDPSFDPTKHVDVQPSILEPYPYIVVVIDEFADMIMVVGKKVEELIARLAQKARASGIHLILATQRPSVDVITGLIKANIPSRIAFQVSTRIDSRTILDQGGAEQLLGNGDMLYMPPGTGLPQRIHGAFVSDEEVEVTVNYLKENGEPKYLDDVLQDTGGASAPIPGLEPLADSEGDALYDQGVSIVTESRRASISYLQRRLKIGYNRAASMIEDMEKAGVVSETQSNGTREVLAPPPVKD
ncbi:DNA translocase FtsK [Leucothrix arctica]|uniref:DNA translocase FtsK n=1 Tax=Leucothrix arctica TaxID=1481894 RepID=A0A317C5H1_9GAMM|nr:DNA translocase FtsK [Leucothrix arctica]PWQ93864.1 cell division protein FtsK [Leucothrix arctica]